MNGLLRKRFTAGLALGAAIGLLGAAGCEKKKVDGGAASTPTASTPTTPTASPSVAPADAAPPAADEPADAAPPAGALVLTEQGLGGLNAATPGTLAGMRAALPGLEIREAEISAGEDQTSRGFDLVRGGKVIAQVVLDDEGVVSFLDATGEGGDENAAIAIRTSDGIAVGASSADVRKAGADHCEIVKTAEDQIDDWPDATCLREGGHIRYELQLVEDGKPAPTRTGPLGSLPAKVVRVLWFADARHAVLL